MRHLIRHSIKHTKPRKTVLCYKLRVNWDKACIDDLGRQTVVNDGKEVRFRLIYPPAAQSLLGCCRNTKKL